jgi:hypothetical protein
MKPLGNIAETLIVLIAGNPQIEFLFTCSKNGTAFSLDTRRIKKELEGVPVNSSPVLSFLRDYLATSLQDIIN